MMNDALNSDAAAQQAAEAKPDRRVAQPRKTRFGSARTCAEQALFDGSWVDPKVAAAADAAAWAQAVRNSVARKLDGGSLAVTSEDLTRLDGALTAAKPRLGELSPKHPDALIPALS
jgi:4'-phosphopantetheinyl transferase EntD